MMSVACAVAEGYVAVCGLCCHWRLLRSVACADARDHVVTNLWKSDLCSCCVKNTEATSAVELMTADSQLRARAQKPSLMALLLPPK